MERISPQMLGLATSEMTLFSGRAAPEATGHAGAPPLRRLLRAATRWRWVLLGGVAAGALAGIALTLVMPRQYASTARMEISRETARVVKIDSVERDTSIGDQEFYQTQYGLLRTQVLAERVARDLGVVDDPAFFKLFGRRDLFQDGKADPTARAKRNEVAGKILLLHVGVAPVRGSSLVDIRAVTPDPVLSQKIAKAWSENYIASNLERRFDASSYARKFLEGRIEQLREKLEVSERDVVAYAAQQGIINLPSPIDPNTGGAAGGGGRSLLTDDLIALNSALEVATAERIVAESRLNEAKRPDASSIALGNDAIASMRQRRADAAAEYAKLMVQFRPDYPQAQALASQVQALDVSIAQEENRVRVSLRQAYESSVMRERSLLARVQDLKGGLTDLRRRSIQYNIYQREADTNRELYNALLQRYKEIGVAGGIENNNVAIVDPARLPDRPSSPKLLVNLVLAMLGGGLVGALIAAGLEQIDEGIADPADLEEKLGLPLLGVAPKTQLEDPLRALRDPRSKLVEAYLAVQANLELSTPQGAPRSLAVISTRPREGKSTTTVALAQSLARARRKVVLVDADLRSPSVHSAFGLKNGVGISNFLSGADDLDGALHKTEHEGLWVMTAGPQPPNAGDLLMGDRLGLLVKRLKERFDHVIVDSPPVIGLADAPLVAAAVDGVVYAVEARATPAGTVRTALSRLRTSQARVVGAVLTKFEAKKAGYGSDYGYDYDYGR
ncbi:polysaccharide biosynthesis tyrosine autokinase [Caulobacter sp. BK020]|uniref:GumC family protein n=1 Tax=Caulobacter sp. BK020 TaxID=2512117 RepID=UPI0010448C82|nr:polysaccharide biosynthesis tyrosine autokinase [Caulobacter sp. BK020]TCS14894.1 capsular exopolysaccharide synthesis family protein [Caulobacter sp. BK020]